MNKIKITVGMGSCGIAAGASLVIDALKKHTSKLSNVYVCKTGCIGICKYEPIVEIFKDGKRITYINVKPTDVEQIVDESVLKNKIIKKLAINNEDNNILSDQFLKKQTRNVLKNCGTIDPENIDDYGNYDALNKTLTKMTKDEVISLIKDSKLRGRGGAGFYTGIKWEMAKISAKEQKYVICNADEGDPGAFMDRAILEGNPHSVIEAMIIAGYAIGATIGFISVREV